ncbi:isoprenyl transferase [Candidatus Bipolaricaulota bacterium]|nr:isoprenyl transferase [Candidatus Bipolaricaulota bacterium]
MNDSIEQLKAAGLPVHVAIILDGNGRWAQRRNLSRVEGHVAGAKAVERLIRFAARELELQYLTLFAFSAENWRRPKQEVDALMSLLKQFALEKLPDLKSAGIRLRVAGDIARLPQDTREAVEYVIGETENGEGLNLTIALNYGSQQEILRACKRIVRAVTSGELSEDDVNQESIMANLYTAGMPDPDLIIRTSGEQRLSNFLLWQAAYAELAFPETLWPDFTPEEFMKILEEFGMRERRFGTVEGE